MFFQQLINGLSIGSVYALMAVGYSLIYSLLNFTNFAHSITVTIGAFTAFFFLSLVLKNLYLAILIAVLIAGALAMLIEITTYRPLLQKNARRIYLLIAGLGISTMGENLVIILFGGRFRAYPVTFSNEPVDIFHASVGQVDLIILMVSMLALILVEVFIQKSRSGLAIRSASFDLDTTSLMGVNVQKLILIVFMVAGGLAGLAGVFLGVKYTAYPTIGALTNKAFISSVFGGLGSIPGAVLGALILGVGETMISGYVSSSLRDVFSFSVLVIILIVRPAGLMGKVSEDKA
ncbi:branched-chain amino acid ABC transporter permease [Petroclostridium sp. X23]|uniref:branched-chain amino acid ABC transporter permease n=1 Tax=Petroclostridium sp. X23 TaxID=3045146 RepID=UPI0024AC8823|nr:branched-chain amino acid ABC transporter permease [Petroclostridium sp. X23]WHH61252.1 branched-chain amino acid ABC transporter permease [Petroclostridium sp. X23]